MAARMSRLPPSRRSALSDITRYIMCCGSLDLSEKPWSAKSPRAAWWRTSPSGSSSAVTRARTERLGSGQPLHGLVGGGEHLDHGLEPARIGPNLPEGLRHIDLRAADPRAPLGLEQLHQRKLCPARTQRTQTDHSARVGRISIRRRG